MQNPPEDEEADGHIEGRARTAEAEDNPHDQQQQQQHHGDVLHRGGGVRVRGRGGRRARGGGAGGGAGAGDGRGGGAGLRRTRGGGRGGAAGLEGVYRRRPGPRDVGGVGDPADLAALRDALVEQRERLDFADVVKAKLQTGEYVAVQNPDKRAHSSVWVTFRVVKDARSTLNVGANVCSMCGFVLRSQGDSCTTTMKRHIRVDGRCVNEEEGEGGAGGSGVGHGPRPNLKTPKKRPLPPPDAKRYGKDLAAASCSEAMLSFDAVCSEPVADLLQGMIDIGNRYGPVDVKEVLPCATTLSEHVKEQARAIRAETTVPRVKEAIAADACAATVDEWTEDMTKQPFISFVVHTVQKDGLQVDYLVTIAYNQEDAKGETIRATLLAALAELGLSEEDVKRITFVTDNGSNIVKALEGFKRLYCMCHALNVCLDTGLSIKYHELIINCLRNVPRAMQVVEACDDVVCYVKGLRGRGQAAPRRLKDGLKKPLQHHSYSKMLLSMRTRLEEVRRFLESRGEEGRLNGVTAEELDDLLEFLAPLDYSAGREASSEVTLSAWPTLLAHASPAPTQEVAADDEGAADDPPPPCSALVTALRKQLQDELHLMELVEQVHLCKKLVRFLKQGDLSHRLSKTVKQECEVRWNSTYTMLQSVDAVWDEIVTLLGAGHERMAGLNRGTLQMLLQFLKPFLEESKKLEGEDYPTLPLALLATCRLKKHCARAILPQSAEGEEDQDAAAEDVQERLSFTLLRRNVLQQLGTTVNLTTEHKLATVLHPTYRHLRMLPPGERSQVFDALRERVAALPRERPQEEQAPPPKKSKLDDGYDDDWASDVATAAEDLGVCVDDIGPEVCEEVDRYLREATATTHENLLKWWETEGAAYPNLQIIARQILAIPASSASSERVFSKAGFIINPRRTCLGGKTVDALIFLQQYHAKLRKLRKV